MLCLPVKRTLSGFGRGIFANLQIKPESVLAPSRSTWSRLAFAGEPYPKTETMSKQFLYVQFEVTPR
jgi:hypothetical protein